MENVNPGQQILAADNRLLEKITKARMINRKESRKHAILSNTVVLQTKSIS